ncbi:MAG: EF-hand domain-containing protein [Ilumatobacteraceae bacterium]
MSTRARLNPVVPTFGNVDAPAVITDLNRDGKIDKKDLKRLGVASNIVEVPFRISN